MTKKRPSLLKCRHEMKDFKCIKCGMEAKRFGIKNEGWDEEDLADLIAWVYRVDKMAYDVNNCTRGLYCHELGNTITSMIEYLKALRDHLDYIIENLEV